MSQLLSAPVVPNFELLRKAYNLFKEIPPAAINLDLIISKQGTDTTPECGTICCGMGWLALSPEFQELGISLSWVTGHLHWQGKEQPFARVASWLFGVSLDEAEFLFEPASRRVRPPVKEHKALLLQRMEVIFEQHGVALNDPIPA